MLWALEQLDPRSTIGCKRHYGSAMGWSRSRVVGLIQLQGLDHAKVQSGKQISFSLAGHGHGQVNGGPRQFSLFRRQYIVPWHPWIYTLFRVWLCGGFISAAYGFAYYIIRKIGTIPYTGRGVWRQLVQGGGVYNILSLPRLN